MPKNSYAGCPNLSPVISAQFMLEMCIAAENCPKPTKNSYFMDSKSFNVVEVGTTKVRH